MKVANVPHPSATRVATPEPLKKAVLDWTRTTMGDNIGETMLKYSSALSSFMQHFPSLLSRLLLDAIDLVLI